MIGIVLYKNSKRLMGLKKSQKRNMSHGEKIISVQD